MFKYGLLLFLPSLTWASLYPYDANAMELFLDIDVNQDKNIDVDEVDRYFNAFDSSHDGKITRHEFDVYISLHYPNLKPYVHQLYDRFDVNSDHHLNHADFDHLFFLVDGDNNGLISQVEFVRFFVVLFQQLDQNLMNVPY